MTSKNQLRTRRMSDSTFGFLLMVPALLVLLVVIAFPILKGIYASFCDYGLKELRKGIFDLKWNNFANYKIMLQNNQIFSYFKNTFVFVALVVVIQLILGMGIAFAGQQDQGTRHAARPDAGSVDDPLRCYRDCLEIHDELQLRCDQLDRL